MYKKYEWTCISWSCFYIRELELHLIFSYISNSHQVINSHKFLPNQSCALRIFIILLVSLLWARNTVMFLFVNPTLILFITFCWYMVENLENIYTKRKITWNFYCPNFLFCVTLFR